MGKLPSSGSEKKFAITDKKVDLIECTSQAPNLSRKRKRKHSNQTDGSGGRETKKTGIELKAMDQKSDLISQLPDHIIHHILFLLQCKKDAARTSILSKRWKDIWASYLVLDFDQRKFHNQELEFHYRSSRIYQKIKKKKDMEILRKHEIFWNFVDNTLQRCIEQNSGIQKFRLHLTSYNSESSYCVDRWIDFAIKSNIQELDLYIPGKKYRYYYLPQTVFAAKSIIALRISGCLLGTCNDIKLSNLRKLWIGKQHVDEERIGNLINSCPLLEDLRLIYCNGLKALVLSSSKIHRIDVHFCHILKKVEIQAPSLQTFWYYGKRRCNINLAMCGNLKSLTLEDANMKDDLFQSQLSKFPILEQLALSECNSLRQITISSHRLKNLALRNCKNLSEALIDAPNLLSFEYRGHGIPFSSLNASTLKEAKLYFLPPIMHVDDDGDLSHKLQNFIKNFDCSKDLKLVVRSGKNAIIHEDLRQTLVPRNFDLKLEFIKSSTSLEDIFDNVLRTWHPETLTIVSSTTSDFLEQVYKKIVVRGEEPSCCSYNTWSNKCWRHFLMDANVENLGDTENKSDWIDWLKSYANIANHLAFYRLDWKPRCTWSNGLNA